MSDTFLKNKFSKFTKTTPTTGWGQVLLCGWAGAWHWAESWKTWSGGRRRSNEFFLTSEPQGLGRGADMPGALDHQPEGGAGLDHRQQHEACCQAAYQQVMWSFLCPCRQIFDNVKPRHNNKYSYTGASDDNLLKNIELFDKLSLRFSNRVLFIKVG